MRRRRLILGTLSMGYGKAVTAFAQLLLVPVLANAWGVELYGQWLMLATIPVFLAASDFGFGTAAGNRLIAEVARGEAAQALATFRSALAVILGCSLAIAALAVATALLLPEHLLDAQAGLSGAAARAVLLVLICYGVVALQGGLFMAVMRAEGAFARSTTAEATVQLIEALSVAAVALAGHGPFVAALALLVVRSLGVFSHVLLAWFHAAWLRFRRGAADPAIMRELLRPALAAMLLPLATAGLLQGTALAIGAAAGAAAVPVYTSLRTLSRVGLQLLMTVNLPILPEFTAEYARGNRDWVLRVAGGLASFNALAGLGGGAVLVLFGNRLLGLWTQGAIQAPEPMLLLTGVAILAGTVWNPLSNLLVAVNRHEHFTTVLAAGVAITVPLTYAATSVKGLNGAAAATLCLDLLLLACAVQQARKAFGPLRFGAASIAALAPARRQRVRGD